jgi:hypothetical protein
MSTDISEEHIASVFRVKEKAEQEMSVAFQRNTRRYIPEDSNLHDHRCENFKSYISKIPLHQAILLA